MSNFIDIVFDGPPGPECGRFIEVEDDAGRSIRVGEWVDRGDGYWVLRLDVKSEIERRQRHTHIAGTTIGKDIDTCAKCGHDIRHSIHERSAS